MTQNSISRRAAMAAAACALACAVAAPALAQATWPSKPVRIIVPYPAGGVGDLGTRAFAQRLSQRIGQAVTVENLPGGTQIVGMQALVKSPPDGHTLILASPTSLVLNPALRTTLPYAPEKLMLVSQLFSSPLFVIASNKLPANNVRELVAYARANPDAVNYASTGEGSATHLATALFAQMTGTRMRHVPYKGSSGANVDLMSGEIQLHFDPGAGTLALVADGKLKALAVSGAQRSRTLPNVPTVIESGVPGYDVVSWWALAAPEGTPRAVAEQIAAAVAKTVADPALADQGQKLSIEYTASTPEEFTAFVGRERQRWGQMIRTLDIKPE
ncbi:MAG: tripartite tricarboxylate transporter substrate binding protein [Comamonadaceae bacterium]|nr:MAG: tripartite tricarboxylate transporter substrate binding protein [Comamonadaceae bacterium]